MKKENAPKGKNKAKLNLLNATTRLSEEVIKRTANNARLYRLICKLVSSEGLTAKQVASITGANNPYSEIEQLRKTGWIILNTHHKALDRDGIMRPFDRYHLSPIQLQDAIRVIEYFDSAA